MKAIHLILLLLVSCQSAVLPDGTRLHGIGNDVAYEKTPDGTIRYVSQSSQSFAIAVTTGGSVANNIVDGSVTKFVTDKYIGLQKITAEAEGVSLIKGTKDPNIIPQNPNIIPVNPNR